MIRITLVRHGETYNNRDHVVQGQDPTQGRLTDKGLRQGELLGQALADRAFDIVYVSPLERAALTMALVVRAQPGRRTLPLVFAPELKEVHLGVLQGHPHAEWKAVITGDPMSYRPQGGESWLDVQARVTRYLRAQILPQGYREILIVAHGGVNRGLIASLTGMTMGDTWREAGIGVPQENTCVNVLELDDAGELVAALANDTSHLHPEFPEAGPGQRWHAQQRRWQLLGQPGAGSHEFIPVG